MPMAKRWMNLLFWVFWIWITRWALSTCWFFFLDIFFCLFSSYFWYIFFCVRLFWARVSNDMETHSMSSIRRSQNEFCFSANGFSGKFWLLLCDYKNGKFQWKPRCGLVSFSMPTTVTIMGPLCFAKHGYFSPLLCFSRLATHPEATGAPQQKVNRTESPKRNGKTKKNNIRFCHLNICICFDWIETENTNLFETKIKKTKYWVPVRNIKLNRFDDCCFFLAHGVHLFASKCNHVPLSSNYTIAGYKRYAKLRFHFDFEKVVKTKCNILLGTNSRQKRQRGVRPSHQFLFLFRIKRSFPIF